MSEDFQIQLTGELAQELADLHAEYLVYLDSLPPDLRSSINKMPAPDVRMSPGRLSVLALPFWVGETLGVDLETCRQIALANIYGLLHFIAQDNITDGKWSEETLPANVISSTLCLQQMFTHYQRFFAPHSPFWSLLNQYWLEWASSIAWEQQARSNSSFAEQDLIKAARKAAPLKICTSGLALLSQREDLIPSLELAIDRMHMVIQMADDLMDMAEDLASNRYNSALSMLISKGALDPRSSPEINQIGRALYVSGDDKTYFLRMQEIAKEARALVDGMGFPYWSKLIEQAVQIAIDWRDRILETILSEELVPLTDADVAESRITNNTLSD